MKRKAQAKLRQWRLRPERRPLILFGARQVGKTWLLKDFGKSDYPQTAYFNFEETPHLCRLFEDDLDPERILVGLRIEAGLPIKEDTTLIVFDEVQACPNALTSLKYFAEKAPQYHLAAAGSLPGMALHSGTSFPVGKVDFLNLYPLSFTEYLSASGREDFVSLIEKRDWALLEVFREKLIENLRLYMLLGGMPEVIRVFLETKDANEARVIQKRLVNSYEQDFSKYAPRELVPRIRAVWDSLPAQLSREQKKFVYGLIREGARAREYEMAIRWLMDAGLLYKVHGVSKPGLPLKSYQQPSGFKIFMHDTGILCTLSNLPFDAVLRGAAFFEEFKGALTEQFALQELRGVEDSDFFYWSSDKGSAEVDFLLQTERGVYPLEIKATENLQAKSLKVYRDKFNPPRCFRSSLSHYREESWITNIPLYALSILPAILRNR